MIKVENGRVIVQGSQKDLTIEFAELITSMLEKEPSIMVGVLSYYTTKQKEAVNHVVGEDINEVYSLLTLWEKIKKEHPNE